MDNQRRTATSCSSTFKRFNLILSHIFEFYLNKTKLYIFSDSNQLEDGEVDPDDSQDVESRQGGETARHRFQRDPNSGPSKRDKLFTLERISNQQMNLPDGHQPQTHVHHQHHHNQQHYHNQNQASSHYNQYHTSNHFNSHSNLQYSKHNQANFERQPQDNVPNVSRRTFDLLDKSLNDLATKTGNIGSIEVYKPPAPLIHNDSSQLDMIELDIRPNLAQNILQSLVQMSRNFSQLSQTDHNYLQMIGRWGKPVYNFN